MSGWRRWGMPSLLAARTGYSPLETRSVAGIKTHPDFSTIGLSCSEMPSYSKRQIPLGLNEQAALAPEAAALRAPYGRPLTFRALVDQIESAGEALQTAGACAGTAIALSLTQGPVAVTAALAIMTTSACAPVDSNLTAKEYQDYLTRLRPAALVWEEGSNPVAAQAARDLGIGVIGLRIPRAGAAGVFEIADVTAAAKDLDVRQTDQAMILQTSATTGEPKLVPRSHAALATLARDNALGLELSAADRYLNLISISHAAAPDAIFAQLVSGGSVFCAPEFREDSFLDWLDDFRPTWFLATPTVHRAILLAIQQMKPEILAGIPLRFLRTGGAPAGSELIQLLEQRFGVPVLEGYGLAEVPTVSRNRLGWRKPGSVGTSTGPEIAIRDESGTFLPSDAEGEVVLRGPTVMPAYLDNLEANREAFQDGWFRTGDIGRLDADGFLFLAGRRKELINRGAKKVFPQEVDDALMRHPAVAEAATFAVPHRSLGEEVAACAILRAGRRVSERELREFTSERLAAFKIPRRIFFVPGIPKTASGKPKRLELTRQFGEGPAPARSLEAGPGTSRRPTEMEAMLLTIWADVLGIEPSGIDDDFFDLGGDSLTAAILLRRVLDFFGRGQEQLVQAEFLDRPTVASLARILSGRPEPSPASALSNSTVVFRTQGGRTPFFLFCNSLTEAYQLRHLSRRLDPEQPFVALCPPEPVRGNRLLTVANMAEESRASIRAVRPSGPYVLGAYCGVAPLAYETALQFQAEGERVPLLILFDAPAPGYPKVSRRANAYLTHAARILRGAAGISLPDVLEHVGMVGRLASRRRRAKVLRARVSSGVADPGNNTPPILTVCEEYVLRPFPARIVHFLAGDLRVSTRVLTDPRCGWADFAVGGLEEHYVAGDHASLFTEIHAPALAARIQNTIDAVFR
jgi:acyl-CoA synthetase (AMP-forming)/AMP-acid ligase II/thioesterase domain-containing protein